MTTKTDNLTIKANLAKEAISLATGTPANTKDKSIVVLTGRIFDIVIQGIQNENQTLNDLTDDQKTFCTRHIAFYLINRKSKDHVTPTREIAKTAYGLFAQSGNDPKDIYLYTQFLSRKSSYMNTKERLQMDNTTPCLPPPKQEELPPKTPSPTNTESTVSNNSVSESSTSSVPTKGFMQRTLSKLTGK